MSRYAELFRGRRVFMPFLMAGDPDVERSLVALRGALDGGADAIELGFPFSDPIADGPVIQRSADRALRAGFRVDDGFRVVRELRATSAAPVGLLLYTNLLVRRGVDRFLAEAAAAGVDGILAADLPVEEADDFVAACRRHAVDSIFMVTPTTTDDRVRQVARLATGYIYVVARLGVTGARAGLADTTLALVRRVRPLTATPLVVGFGISTPEQAAAVVDAGADGVIVGSALTAHLEPYLDAGAALGEAARSFVAEVRAALDAGR